MNNRIKPYLDALPVKIIIVIEINTNNKRNPKEVVGAYTKHMSDYANYKKNPRRTY
jgi:hypothetical protein